MPLRKTSVNMACNCSPRTPQIYVPFYSLAKNLGCVVIGRNKSTLKLSQDYHVVCYGNPSMGEQSSKSPFWHIRTKFDKSQSMTMKKVFK